MKFGAVANECATKTNAPHPKTCICSHSPSVDPHCERVHELESYGFLVPYHGCTGRVRDDEVRVRHVADREELCA
jgi:hypothetical protein